MKFCDCCDATLTDAEIANAANTYGQDLCEGCTKAQDEAAGLLPIDVDDNAEWLADQATIMRESGEVW